MYEKQPYNPKHLRKFEFPQINSNLRKFQIKKAGGKIGNTKVGICLLRTLQIAFQSFPKSNKCHLFD